MITLLGTSMAILIGLLTWQFVASSHEKLS